MSTNKNTATVTYNDQTFVLPIDDVEFVGRFGLDEDWRTMDYAVNSNLGLSVTGNIAFTPESHEALVNVSNEADLDEMPNALVPLDIPITHTDMDAPNSFVPFPLDVLPLFPKLADLESYTANEVVREQAGFWFGGMGDIAQISSLKISGIGPFKSIEVAGSATDTRGTLHFILQFPALPFSVIVDIAGYANTFTGLDKEARIKEINDCFASLYGTEKYTTEVLYATEDEIETRVKFTFTA
ncbi:MAG: hypothetical protein RLZZ70_59 [Candidatus Parcubacteria bacterium]|jgi:hypothetical protein